MRHERLTHEALIALSISLWGLAIVVAVVGTFAPSRPLAVDAIVVALLAMTTSLIVTVRGFKAWASHLIALWQEDVPAPVTLQSMHRHSSDGARRQTS